MTSICLIPRLSPSDRNANVASSSCAMIKNMSNGNDTDAHACNAKGTVCCDFLKRNTVEFMIVEPKRKLNVSEHVKT